MHSLGNDFVIIDAITQNVKLNSAYIKKIADRHTGIGCDQIIVLDPPTNHLADFYYRVYNADGKSAEQCLNGVRCAARFALDNGLIKKSSIIAEGASGQVTLTINDNQIVAANLGTIHPNINELSLKLPAIDNLITIYNLSIGNNHAICIINNFINKRENCNDISFIEDDHLDHQIYVELANQVADKKELYPQGVNIGFAKIRANNCIQLRVFERGSGETLACGSNAVAAFLVAKHLHLIEDQVDVMFKLGTLNVKLLNQDLITEGSVHSIFCGKFKI